MKKQLIPYIKTYLFLIISYLIVSIIMALLCTFIHLSSFVYQIIIYFFSYFILLLSCLFLFKLQKEKHMIHGIIYAFSYLVLEFLVHIDSLNVFMIIKPVIIFIIFLILCYIKKNNNL